MHIVRLKISSFRGVRSSDISLGRHAVLVGPNNSGKTTIIEAQHRQTNVSPPRS